MADNFRTRLSQSGHRLFCGAARYRAANQLMESARACVPPLRLGGMTLTVSQAHFGNDGFAKGSLTGMHCHGQIQLEYVMAGAFLFTTPSERLLLRPGEGMVTLPDHPHAWVCRRAGIMMGVLVETGGPGRSLERLAESLASDMPAFGGETGGRLMADMLALLHPENVSPWTVAQCGCLFGAWITDALRQAWPIDAWPKRAGSRGENVFPEAEDNIRAEQLCCRARGFLAANCTRAVRVADAAREAGLSVRHLERLYRNVYGESVGADLGRMRLERARELLRTEPELPVKTVAYRCGFASHAYFSACYRRAYGRSPADERR